MYITFGQIKITGNCNTYLGKSWVVIKLTYMNHGQKSNNIITFIMQVHFVFILQSDKIKIAKFFATPFHLKIAKFYIRENNPLYGIRNHSKTGSPGDNSTKDLVKFRN